MSVKKNTIYNLSATVLPLIAALYSIPRLMAVLGNERFSILLIIWSLIGYFSLFDFGVGRALTHELSQIKDQSVKLIDTYIKSGIVIVSLTAMLGLVLVYFFAYFVVGRWYHLSDSVVKDAINAMAITAITVIPTTITSGLRGALEGLGKFLESNINRMILGTSVFAAPLISVTLNGQSLTHIAIYLLIIRILITALSFWQLRHYVFFSLDKKNVFDLVPKIFKYGFWVSISGITSPLMVYGDRFLLAAIISTASVAYYATPQEGLVRLLIIPGALAGALFHEFSSKKTEISLFDVQYYEKKIGLVLMAISIVIALTSYYFYRIWINETFANNAYLPTVIMSAGILFYSLGLIHITTLSSLGEVKYIGCLHAIELVFYIPIYYFFAKEFNIIGASIVWTFRAFVDYLLLRKKSINVLLK